MIERIPPHSEEAERAVIGSVLLDASVFDLLKAEYEIRDEHFYIPAHREIWLAMESLSAAGRAVDIVTLIDSLKRAKSLERVGGGAYLDSLMESTPTAAHVEHYAEKVVNTASLRTVLQAARIIERDSLAQDAEDGRTVAARGITALCEVLKTKEPDTTVLNDMDESITEWEAAAANRLAGHPHKMAGLATGLRRIDQLTDGLQPGLVVLGARESTGKTTLEGQMLGRIMRVEGLPTLRITRDSRRKALTQRDLCREAQVSLSALSKGYMTVHQREAIGQARSEISRWKERIITNLYKMPDVCALIRSDVHKRETAIVSLDFIQMFSTGNPRTDADRNGKLETIMGMLKNLTFELGIPILILSQFARDKDGQKGRYGVNWITQKPILADLKDSGAIEQLADVAILLSKVDDMPDDDGRIGTRTILGCEVAKNKQGPTGSTFLNFHRPVFTMDEVTDQQQAAITKFLRDEHDIKANKRKVETLDSPYYESIADAMRDLTSNRSATR